MRSAFGQTRGSRPTETRRHRARALLSGLLVLTVLATAGVASIGTTVPVAAQVVDSDFPTAAVAPEDALAYLVFTLDTESDQWQLASDLLNRAGLGDLLEQARDEALTDAAGNDLPLDVFLGGEIALVLTDEVLQAAAESGLDMTGGTVGTDATPVDPTSAPQATGAAVVLDAPAAPDTAYAGIRSYLQDQATEAGTEVAETDYEGVTIEYVAAGDEAGDPMAIARVDDLILLAASPTDLEPLIDTSQGTTAPVAESTPFTDVRGELDEDYLLYGFFNGVAALEAQEALNLEGNPFAALQNPERANGYSGILLRADDPGFRMETILLPAEGASLPPAAANFESELLTQTPSDALFFLGAAELGQTRFLDALGAAVIVIATGQLGATATPTPDQSPEDFIAARYEQAAALIGVNLQTDLFQQLVGEYGLWIRADEDPSSIAALFASGVEDPGTVVNALRQLTLLIQGGGGGGINVTTRQVEGAQVNVIDTGDPAAPDIEYGVVDGRLLIGLGNAIDDFVEGPDDALADNPQFREVINTLPAERNGTLYVDLAQIIPLFQGLARASAVEETGEIEDASDACADYDTQEEAQEAYDAGEEGTFNLDQDFDGEACEDFFAATPVAEASPVDPAAVVAEADYSAIKAFALAAYDEGGNRRTSSILYIDDEGAAATPEA